MNKYPLDNQAVQESVRDLLLHDQAQAQLIGQLHEKLVSLIENEDIADLLDDDEVDEIEDLTRGLTRRKADFETHRFNQKNGHNVRDKSPYERTPETLGAIGTIDLMKENQLNALEAEGSEGAWTEEELAKYFGEAKPKKKKKGKEFSKMSLEEIEEWEKKQDNSNDIYKLSARIKNLARAGAGANLTPAGDILCNSYTHVVKALYDFAETIQDKETKIKLTELIRKNENVPAQIVAALGAGVKTK